MRHRWTAALLLTAFSTIDLSAQVTGRPPRSTEGPERTTGGLFGGKRRAEPTRMQQQLSFTFDVLGGYEDNLSPERENVATDPTTSRHAGTTGTAAAVLQYQRMSSTRGIEASARTVGAAYSGVNIRPSLGGSANVRAFGRVSDRVTLNGWAEADYRPTFTLNGAGIGAVPNDAVAPQDLAGGAVEVTSVNFTGGGSTTLDWTPRHHSSVSYTRGRMRSTTFNNGAQVSQTVAFTQRWDFAKNVGVDGSYSVLRQTSDGEGDASQASDLDTRTPSVGVELRVPVSRSRRLTFNVQGGATQVETTNAATNAPIEYVTPSGAASARLDLGRTWALSSQVQRVVTSVEGLTRQSFVTTMTTYWLGGNLGSRSLLSVDGTYTTGEPHQGDTGSFRSLGGTAQIQYRLSRCCAAVSSYSYYEHRVRDIAAVPTGFPRTIDRSALRLGLSFWLPLHGTFPTERR